jgi:diacylglycerol O-acyltransferase
MSDLDRHMRETDAFNWTMEKDPALRMTVVCVGLLDGVPDWDEVVHRLDVVSRAVPLFRQRVVATPAGLAPPKWVVDGEFDLGWHVRRIALPPPGDLDALLSLAAALGSEAFDPVRPRWQVWLVEGLHGGGAAWVANVHHTLTDGIGGMQLLTHIFDVDGMPLAGVTVAAPPPPGGTGIARLVGGAVRHNAGQAAAVARGAVVALARTARAARHDPRAAVAGAVETWRSLLEAIEPTGPQMSPVMTGRGLRRRYAVLDVPLDALRAAGRSCGATVNDAYLTGITGGLRRYHELHGGTTDALRMTLPINVREEGDAAAGNRIALIRLELPLLPADPARRIVEVHRRTDRWKGAPGLAYIEAAYGVVNHLPAGYLRGLARKVDFVGSNVPAFPLPVQLAGPRLTALYAFGPTGGTAANVTMMSYAGNAHVAVDIDEEAVPDVDAFMTCLRAGFDEVAALGAVPSVEGPMVSVTA